MNENKFNGKADNYALYRPSYPDSLIDWLYTQTNAKTVCDIGAGTGIFTECLMKKPWTITAVEPNPDMCKYLEKLSEIEIVSASAENTGLPDNSTDLITTAQAFHWFDENRFKAECKRILTPNGKLAIVFNERINSGIAHERNRICMKYCNSFHTGHVGKRGTEDGDLFLQNEYFNKVDYFNAENNVTMTKEHFIGDTLSRSYALNESNENYSDFISELEQAFEYYQKNGTIKVEYKTSCYLGTL